MSAIASVGAAAHADHHIDQKMIGHPDGSFIALRGTVIDPADNTFLLDYGEGKVAVEVDDWDYDDEGELFLDGDSVTVFGLVDDDFYQTQSIEAEAVYVDDLNATLSNFSAADEEEATFINYYIGPTDYELVLTGVVESTSGREFTIDTGLSEVTIDTMMLAYDPMDDSGFQQIDEGDVVRVSGDLSIDLFDEREIIAESIISYN